MDLALVEGFGRKFCSCGTFGWHTEKKSPLGNEVEVHKQIIGLWIWNTSAFQKSDTVSATT